MAYELQEIRDSVRTYLQDDAAFIGSRALDRAIEDALRQVNRDRPLETKVDIAGDGSADYALPSSFEKGFSRILDVEYPAGEADPIYLRQDDDWYVYEDPSKVAGEKMRLRFRLTTPQAGKDIRVRLTSTHAVTLDGSTLDQNACLGVVYKTLVFLYRAIGARFAQSADAAIAADSVDYGGRTQNYLYLAERYEASYNQVVSIGGDVKAAQGTAEADIVFGHGEDFLWHPRRQR